MMPLSSCVSPRRHAWETTTMEMNILAQMTMSESSPALKVATVLGGIIALFVAIKIGQVMIKLLFGLIGLALFGGAVWWFLARH
jgi:hypothetical protein